MKCITSKQYRSWYAYATTEPVGNPVHIIPPDERKKLRRNRVEGGFNKLMEKQSAGVR